MRKLTLILTLALVIVALCAGMALALPSVDTNLYHVGNEEIEIGVDETDLDGDWTWDGVERILTLDGFSFTAPLSTWREVICVPHNTTIILKGNNEIDRSGTATDYETAILCFNGEAKAETKSDPNYNPYDDEGYDYNGNLTILGPGSLNAVVGEAGVMAGNLTIDDDAELNITLKLNYKSGECGGIGAMLDDELAMLIIRDSQVNIGCDGGNIPPSDDSDGSSEFLFFGIMCAGAISIDNSIVDIPLTGIKNAYSLGIYASVAAPLPSGVKLYGISIDNSLVTVNASLTGLACLPLAGFVEGGGVSIVDSTVKALVPETYPLTDESSIFNEVIFAMGLYGCGIFTTADIYIDNSAVEASGFVAAILASNSMIAMGGYGAADDIRSDGDALIGGAVYGDNLTDLVSKAQIDLERVVVIRGGKVVDYNFYIDPFIYMALDAPTAPLLYGAADGVFGSKIPPAGVYRMGATFSSTADLITVNMVELRLRSQKEEQALYEKWGIKGEGKLTDEQEIELAKLRLSIVEEMYADISKYVDIRPIQEIAQQVIPILSGVGKNFPFIDVALNHWAYQDIFDAFKKGLINGKTATLYMPDGPLTYAEAIKLAACIHQLNSMGAVSFEPSDPWYQTYVSYAELNQIIEKGEFAGQYNDAIIRYDFAHIFGKALPMSAFAPINDINSIPDVPSSNRHADEILMLYRAGILVGSDAAGDFYGNSNIKRSEVAAIVVRMIDPDKRIRK